MRHSLFQNRQEDKTTEVKLSISRPHAKNIGNDVVATGRYDHIEEKWIFSCNEPETLRWLEASFAQPVNVVGGCLPIHSMEFITYMRDVVAHRRGLVINITEGQ